jgi:hypothetical protein
VFVLPNDFTKKYDDSSKMFAFANEPVAINESPGEPLLLYAYNEYEPGKESNAPVNTSTPPNKKEAG